MRTTQIGQAAESAVADFLISKGHKIVDRNWKTRWCEIDIIAQKGKIIYFVEVKYRISPTQGTGLEHITKTKLRQMTFAAQFWTAQNNWNGDWRLLAVSVDGSLGNYSVEEVVEIN